MIDLKLQMFAKGGSGADGLAAYRPQSIDKYKFSSETGAGTHHGSAGGKANLQPGTRSAKESASSKSNSDDNHVSSIQRGETYLLYKVRNGVEKLYDRTDSEEAKYELKGYKFDSKTGLWRDRYGKTYRVKRVRK